MPPKTIILLGAPGSGKDTQAFALAKRYGYFVLVTGDLFRAEISHKSALGVKMKKIMDKGGLLPANVVDEAVSQELERHRSTIKAVGIVFNGHPRLAEEIADVDKLIERYHLQPVRALLLKVERKNLLARLSSRGRQDDAPQIAARRLDVYQKDTWPVVEEYRKRRILTVVDGNPGIAKVTQNVIKAIEELK